MKNQLKNLLQETHAELQAKKAIRQIYKKIEARYPSLSEAEKSKIIVECLLELSEEKKLQTEHILRNIEFSDSHTKQAS